MRNYARNHLGPKRIGRGVRWSVSPVYFAVAMVVTGISLLVPLLSPLLLALLVGILAANGLSAPKARWLSDDSLTKLVLRAGVVLLGLRLPVSELSKIGPMGAVLVVTVVTMTFGLTWTIGRRLQLDRGLIVLIAAGFSVCGAAAIAAVESGIRRRSADVATAIALVTLCGTAMIVLVPVSATLMQLSDTQTGVWAGASIHEVSQVVAAASISGPTALAMASTVKLARVALLGAVFVASKRLAGSDETLGKTPMVPWFVWGFIAAVCLRSAGILPNSVVEVGGLLTNVLLAAAMFGLGLTITLAALKVLERRAMILALSSTFIAAGSSLALAVLFFD